MNHHVIGWLAGHNFGNQGINADAMRRTTRTVLEYSTVGGEDETCLIWSERGHLL